MLSDGYTVNRLESNIAKNTGKISNAGNLYVSSLKYMFKDTNKYSDYLEYVLTLFNLSKLILDYNYSLSINSYSQTFNVNVLVNGVSTPAVRTETFCKNNGKYYSWLIQDTINGIPQDPTYEYRDADIYLPLFCGTAGTNIIDNLINIEDYGS